MKMVNSNAGDSVIYTLTKACHIANHEFKPVLVTVNGVVMYIDDRINLDSLWKTYQQKLDFKFEIERLKQARQK